jgi:hypothetical protein
MDNYLSHSRGQSSQSCIHHTAVCPCIAFLKNVASFKKTADEVSVYTVAVWARRQGFGGK